MSRKYSGLPFFFPFFTTLRPCALHSSACKHTADSATQTLLTEQGRAALTGPVAQLHPGECSNMGLQQTVLLVLRA